MLIVENIKIDMNNPDFQKDLFLLEKPELLAFIKALKKISQLNWDQLYFDRGLRWESIKSKRIEVGQGIYSFRFSQKYRALALRQDNFLRLLSLHVDHDSAYC